MTETPREFYLRAVVKNGALEIVMGLEFDLGTEGITQLRDDMKQLARHVLCGIAAEQVEDIDAMLACRLSYAMGARWPGRRYFLEVQHDDPDEGWVQVITPSGWPPKKETVPVLTEEMAVKLANEGAEAAREYRKVVDGMWKVKP
jgi:hypothetical protein